MEQGYKVTEVARNLEIGASMLNRWKKEFESNQQKAFDKTSIITPEQEELIRLRKEVPQLRMEKEILKKAAAFFVKENL